jgi:hypothetical protein
VQFGRDALIERITDFDPQHTLGYEIERPAEAVRQRRQQLTSDGGRRRVDPGHAEVLAWRERKLPGRKWLNEHGISFTRHYTGSLACVPSRPTIFTGHYPDLYGVTQTNGIGKVYDDSRMRWLRPYEVPSLGSWFRAAGYDTHYDGKWRISHADLHDEVSGGPLATNDDAGIVDAEAVELRGSRSACRIRLFRVGRAGAARCAAGQRGSAARPADRRAGGGLVAGALRASARR